jgi:hypothetical protein
MRYTLLLFVLACLGGKEEGENECPINSSGAQACLCDEGYYGEPLWDETTLAWTGDCLSGLEMAIQTGDPSFVEAPNEILETILTELLTTGENHNSLLQDIYGTDGVYYAPSEWSNHIRSWALEDNFTLVQGSDSNHSLAVAGQHDNSKYAAFGFNVAVSMDNGDQPAFQMPFQRLLSWLLTDSTSETLPTDASIAISSIGWDQNQTISYFESLLGPVEDCDLAEDLPSCYADASLIIIGANGTETEEISSSLRSAMDAGTAVMFLHTETWGESNLGNAILDELQMSYGSYGGNYWANDKAEWSSVDDMIATGGIAGSLQTLLNHLQLSDYVFDWSYCTDFVGQIFCDEVPDIQSDFFAGAQTIQLAFAELDSNNTNLFLEDGSRIWKMVALLADVYRRDITYPMSKTDADIMPFMHSYFADHAVLYNRDFNPLQNDLGTFSDSLSPEDITVETTPITIMASQHGGYTAIGYHAIPGETFTIERTDGTEVNAWLLINTQRTGSTREFNDGQYDRPKFLQSPTIPLPIGQTISLTTPYGGTLQLMVSSSDSNPIIELEINNVGEHPVLNYGDDPTDYLAALENTNFPFTEIRTPYIQIHSKVAMMMESIDSYDGDIQAFFDDLEYYMIQDTYNLAGFAGDGLRLREDVEAFCAQNDWDCNSENLHGQPALQHINVDTYAHCGGGCSGNPYDQAWALGPLGWGETHEIGHNLQRSRLKIYDGRSSEVSNQIFPLHKHLNYYLDTGTSLSADRVNYSGTFDTLQQSISETDPVAFVYENIWASEGIYDNNNERMSFYVQLVHCNNDLPHIADGWDIYTLMYLHERIFSRALEDWENSSANVGFDTYSTAPNDISGNDFMLLSLSYITERDHRSFFDMWGIEYSNNAWNQVEFYNFPVAEQQFTPNDNPNIPPTHSPVSIDGSSTWPSR